MVKRQKEKQYQSTREYRSNHQQQLVSGGNNQQQQQHLQLPYNHCPISLVPYEIPIAIRWTSSSSLTASTTATTSTTTAIQNYGIIFDLHTIMEFVLQYKVHPLTVVSTNNKQQEQSVSFNQQQFQNECIIHLNMDRVDNNNNDNNNETIIWQCPILCKPFTNRSKIIAIVQRHDLEETEEEEEEEEDETDVVNGSIDNHDDNVDDDDNNKDNHRCSSNNKKRRRSSSSSSRLEANVYSYEAYYEFNVKPKQYIDLISGLPFHPTTDVLILYEPPPLVDNHRTTIVNKNVEFHNIRNHHIRNTIRHYRQQHPDDDDDNNNNPTLSSSTSTSIRHSNTSKTIMKTLLLQQQDNNNNNNKVTTSIIQNSNTNNQSSMNKKQKM